MPPNITRVKWSASSLPWGIDFDERNGVFSGIPDEVGEYTIPVMVMTNYGNDTKDVIMIVENQPHQVYAKSVSSSSSSNAYIWSGGAAADSDGFRKINMPEATRLVRLSVGFGARAKDGKWYVVGKGTGDNDCYYGTTGAMTGFRAQNYPQELPIDNILAISSGTWGTSTSVRRFFGCLTAGNIFYYAKSENGGALIGTKTEENVVKICSGETSQGGYIYLTSDGELRPGLTTISGWDATIPVPANQVRKIINTCPTNLSMMTHAPLYITYSGDLYRGPDKISFSGGRIRDIFGRLGTPLSFFAVTEENALYAQGSNDSYSLGFSTTTKRDSLEFIGYYDVKKILTTTSGTLMLTKDGKLYHTGTYMYSSSPTITNLVGEKHKSFTEVFPGHIFHDITYINQTLIVTMENEVN